ncbi:hypothetical protein GCM10012283_19260 [Phycicoccus endophyticus]|nr:hypothetical protein GCM10012283_19260 [Phycicoccus endophyticus]
MQYIQTEAFQAAMSSPETQRSIVRWRRCVGRIALVDTAVEPFDMPTPDLVDRLGIPADLHGQPSVNEIRIASADASCQVSSGFLETLHSNEASVQRRLIHRFANRVDREIAEFAQYDREMRALMAE